MTKPTVLFLCTGNSARSQMAEALLRHVAGDRFDVYSAGTEPKGVHPLTVRVLEEIGVDTVALRSKSLTEYLGKLSVNYLIVVCDNADRECPTAWPGLGARLFWPFRDPAAATGTDEEQLEHFRSVRDEIRMRLADWISSRR